MKLIELFYLATMVNSGWSNNHLHCSSDSNIRQVLPILCRRGESWAHCHDAGLARLSDDVELPARSSCTQPYSLRQTFSKVTRNVLDCDQSNYSSRIIFSYTFTLEPNTNWTGWTFSEIWPWPIYKTADGRDLGFGPTGSRDVRTADPKTLPQNQTRSESHDPLQKYDHLTFSKTASGRHLGFDPPFDLPTSKTPP